MSDPPPIPEPLWQTVPPEAQDALRARFDVLERRIADLEERWPFRHAAVVPTS
jgi:hypothetical protein